MKEADIGVADASPIWRRILNFPLVAMILAVALFVLVNSVARQLGKLLPPMAPNAAAVGKAVIAVGLMFAVYKLTFTRLGDRPRDDLRLADAPKGLVAGLLMGFLLFCMVVGVAALCGVYTIVGRGDTGELVKDLAGMTIASAFMEELLFRGILFRWLEEFAGSWAALVITSALFGLGHLFNPGATWASSLAITVEAGVMLGSAYMLTRSLWLPMGLHAAWNFTQGFIFDVPVSGEQMHGLVQARLSGPALLSGGVFGLEASIIGVVLCTLVGTALLVLAVRRAGTIDAWWNRRPSIAAL